MSLVQMSSILGKEGIVGTEGTSSSQNLQLAI